MKKRITVTVDIATYKALHLDKKNVSGFINELLKEKLIGTYSEKITVQIASKVKQSISEDSDFFNAIVEEVMNRARNY